MVHTWLIILKYNFHTMKSILEINLDSKFDKALYSIHKQALATNLLPPQHYPVDSITYSINDSIDSILFDMVIDFSSHPHSLPIPYSAFFDRNVGDKGPRALIEAITIADAFKRSKIWIGHFLISQEGLFDYYGSPQSQSSNSSREEADEKYLSQEIGLIDQKFSSFLKKQVNLCEEIRPHKIPELISSLRYISAQDFLNCEYSTSMSKLQRLKIKELQTKKVVQFYIVNVQQKIKLNLICLNYNKSYSLSVEEKKQLDYCLMMYQSGLKPINYNSIKIEVISHLIRGTNRLFYYSVFPGPEIDPPVQTQNKSIVFERSLTKSFMKTQSKLSHSFLNLRDQNDRLRLYFCDFFHNLQALQNKDKENLQGIIKSYLEAKEEKLKSELYRVCEKVKQLQMFQRVQKAQIDEYRSQMMKSLQKSLGNIVELRKMGINNVQKHMLWMQSVVQQKKQAIKEAEEQIQNINQRIVETRQKHQYFVGKMIAYRDKLKKKKKCYNIPSHAKQNAIPQLGFSPSTTPTHDDQQYKLTGSALEQLEQFKETLREKMVQRLKQSQEKKMFMDNMDEIRKKVSKLQISKLEQKYFELFQD